MAQGKSETKTSSDSCCSPTPQTQAMTPCGACGLGLLPVPSTYMFLSQPGLQKPCVSPSFPPTPDTCYLSLERPCQACGFHFFLSFGAMQSAHQNGALSYSQGKGKLLKACQCGESSSCLATWAMPQRQGEERAYTVTPLAAFQSWSPAEVWILCLQQLRVLVGDRAGPQGLLPRPPSNLFFCKEAKGALRPCTFPHQPFLHTAA